MKAKLNLPAIIFFIYVIAVAALDWMKFTYATMPDWAARLIVPASIFMPVSGDSAWLGVSTLSLAISLAIYIMLAAIIDYSRK